MGKITEYDRDLNHDRQGENLINGLVQRKEKTVSRVIRIGDIAIDPKELEAAMLMDPQVHECAVLPRTTDVGREELAVYVVLSGSFSLDNLHERLRSSFPEVENACSLIPISNMPYTPEGQIDIPLLGGQEVIDDDLVQKWEGLIGSINEVEKVAVMVGESNRAIPPLHLSDLLINWREKGLKTDVEKESISGPIHEETIETENKIKSALSEGGTQVEVPGTPRTLQETLQRACNMSSDRGIIYIENDDSDQSQSYRQLLSEAECILSGLRKLGLKPQDKVIFQFDHNRDFLSTFWGCILGGFIPVPIGVDPTYKDVNATVGKLFNTWLMLKKPFILTSEKLAPFIRALPDILEMDSLKVATVSELRENQADNSWYASEPDDIALMMLTSGSTGAPKGVTLSHKNLTCRAIGSVQLNGFSEKDITLNWMPLDHVAGIIFFHLRDVFTGCRQIHAPSDPVLADPLIWLDWINHYRATITFAPNFAFSLVNQYEDEIALKKWDLSCMQYILNGAEAIVAKTARRFIQLLIPHGLPATAMHPAWGMSETSSGVVYGDRFSLDSVKDDDSFVEVGLPIPGLSIRIVNEQGNLMGEGQIGDFQVKGLTVTPGYFNNPKANAEVYTDDGWFDTGDLGMIKDGRLTITGRTKDVIIINSVNYYSHEIEGVVEEIEGVEPSYTAACAVRESGEDTDKLAVFFHPVIKEDEQFREILIKIRKIVVQKNGVYPSYLIPVEQEQIPKTEIGKIQRTQLSKRFEEGEFDEILKRIDVLTGNENTIPDWFFQKTWIRKNLTDIGHHSFKGVNLVMMDTLGTGALISKKFEERDLPCVKVETGSGFAEIAEDHYSIDIGNPDEYEILFKTLKKNNIIVENIFHLTTCTGLDEDVQAMEDLEQAQDQGVFSLLFLLQSLNKVQGDSNSVRLFVISNHTQPVQKDDLVTYEKSPVLGLIKTAPQEMPWVKCRHIDFSEDNPEMNADLILSEILSSSGDPEVAYRKGARWIPGLMKMDLANQKQMELPFKEGGMYLLTGGLGGIGSKIAEFLIDRYKVRILLVGRSHLSEESNNVETEKEKNHVKERVLRYKTLQELSGEVLYEAVDISDLARLREIVKNAESKWNCELDGILHLAGTFTEQMLSEATREDYEALFYSKVYGTWALHQLVKNKPGSLFISFSSMNGFFGGFSVAAYSSANAFLENFTHFQRNKASLNSYCLSWSMWDEVGMSRAYKMKDLTRTRGYHAIPLKEGLESFQAILSSGQSNAMIGLEGGNPFIRQYLMNDIWELQDLSAYFTTKNVDSFHQKLKALVVKDRFGNNSRCKFINIPNMPMLDTGEIDRQKLVVSLQSGDEKKTKYVAPRNEMERVIADVWKKILNRDKLDIKDNFFDIGGNSLLMAQVNARLKKILKRNVLVTEMFQYPTIGAIAQYLEKGNDGEVSTEIPSSQSRGEERRRKMQRRKATRRA